MYARLLVSCLCTVGVARTPSPSAAQIGRNSTPGWNRTNASRLSDAKPVISRVPYHRASGVGGMRLFKTHLDLFLHMADKAIRITVPWQSLQLRLYPLRRFHPSVILAYSTLGTSTCTLAGELVAANITMLGFPLRVLLCAQH